MNQRRSADDEQGFTLIEMVIAILIMAIAVVTIVGALTSMIQLTAEHRGHAVTEVGARSFGEAAQAQAQFAPPLTATLGSASTDRTVTVASTSLMPRPDSGDPTVATCTPIGDCNTYFQIDREVVLLRSINSATQITVDRAVNSTSSDNTLAGHGVGTAVVPILRCPTVAQMTPAVGTYLAATGVTSSLSNMEYWNPITSSFTTSRSVCLDGIHSGGTDVDGFDDTCDDPESNAVFVLAECGWGYFRATINVTTPGDARLRNVTTSTKIMLRSGSS